MFRRIAFVCLFLATIPVFAAKPPIYLWFEPEWFPGVEGSFGYWSDSTKPAKPTGKWGIAGPGISAEWTQGGESEWNSMGAPAEETNAICAREIRVPRAGKYRIWVRYYDHRKKTSPFRVVIGQNGKEVLNGELGVEHVVPANDEYQLYWGFSFGWASLDATLESGPAKLTLKIDKAGQAFRQIDAVLITDDLEYKPIGREKPPFAYLGEMAIEPKDPSKWRGSAKEIKTGTGWKRSQLAGKDFTMWTGGVEVDPKWWAKQKVESLTPHDVLFQFCPPTDIREAFHKQFAGRKDIPVLSWPNLVPTLYLGGTPDLSPDAELRKWLERTKLPFSILTNYASGAYTDKNGPPTYAALSGPLADQFLGYIHGEAVGTGGVGHSPKALGTNRREHIDAFAKDLREKQLVDLEKIYKTKIAAEHFKKGISCLSVDSIALAHAFREAGMSTVGYELDATNIHVPMRIAFERGAARQYGGAWINYASGNFGDACNYFTQNPVVPRGAPSWWHSKYAVTDGVSASWYRRMYYLNYLGGASAIFWEQGLTNQFIQPGPGTHLIQLSPFGRATEDFQAFVDRTRDRGEPYTPIAILLNYGHGYERVNNACKMLNYFTETQADVELREFFNVCWYPSGVLEGKPATPDLSMPAGRYGDIFDVLVDRPAKAVAVFDYPVVWAAGDAELEPLLPTLRDYLKRGGTLVLNSQIAGKLPADFLGVKLKGTNVEAEEWSPVGGEAKATTPFEVAAVELAGAEVLAWATPKVPLITRHTVGEGAVILTLCPRMLGRDERAHPALPFLMNGVTAKLLPIEVRLPNGTRPMGEIAYQINRNKDGWLVTLMNSRGVDKTQHGVARVDRTQFADVVVKISVPVLSVKEMTEPRDLVMEKNGTTSELKIRVHPGDLKVIQLKVR